jgi:hypothetical protein
MPTPVVEATTPATIPKAPMPTPEEDAPTPTASVEATTATQQTAQAPQQPAAVTVQSQAPLQPDIPPTSAYPVRPNGFQDPVCHKDTDPHHTHSLALSPLTVRPPSQQLSLLTHVPQSHQRQQNPRCQLNDWLPTFSTLRHFHGTRCNASCSHHPYLSQNQEQAKDGSTSSSAFEHKEDPSQPKWDILHSIPILV